VMAHFSSALLSEAITAPERVRLDFRTYGWLGNVSEDVRVCYLRSASGIRNWQDMVARNEVVFGATAQGNAGNVDTAMLRDRFGVKLKQVSGYAGSAEKRLAVEKGEIDGDCGGWTSVPDDWLRDRKINVMVRLSPTLGVQDFFTPSNFASLNSSDNDLGSSGPIFVPGTNLLVMGGKGGGTCYLVNSTSMGHVVSGGTQWHCVDPDNVRSGLTHHLHNSMVGWSGPSGTNLYTWGENDFGRMWRFNGSTFNTPAASIGTMKQA